MKITCHSCQAKYTIADEKVAGKTVKIKCKKCSATIVVHGDQQGGVGQTLDPNLVLGAASGEEDVETRVFNGETGQLPGGTDEWTVNVSDDDQRTLTTPQIVEGWQNGTLNADTYVWKDGMGDWLPITSVPELMQLIGAGPAAVAAEPQFGLGGTMMMEPPSAAAKSSGQAAAKRAARPGAVDLFGAQPAPPAAAQGDMQGGPLGSDRLVGERNENSVLFSLSALTATENAARVQSVAPSPNAGRGPAAPRPGQNGGRAGLDDIMNMSGGLSAAPMLAPPPLLAPVIEAPPPPQMMHPQMGPPSGYPGGMHGAQAGFAMPTHQAPQKSKAGLIIGLLLAVVVIGGGAAFFLTRPSTDATATKDSASGTATTAAAPATPSGAADAASATPSATPSAVAAAPTETGAPAAEPSADAKTADNKPTTGGHGKVSGPLPKEAKKEEKEEKKAPEKAEEPKKKEEAPAAGGGGEFNRGAATSALGAAAGAARRCAKPDGPTGGGRVKVTFAPSGNVTSATVEGPPFAGTSVGGCIAGAFRGAHVPAFEGSPVSVTKSFSIN